MAIKNIPNILYGGQEKPYGGFIYGLSMEIGYSSEPSRLTVDIINENGIYSTPILNTSTFVTFGSFKFVGTIWSYTIKENAGEKTLQVVLVDNSIILDRYYVLLWKRGLLGEKGTRETPKNVTFDFSDEKVVVPKRNNNYSSYPFTEFEEKTLGRIIKTAPATHFVQKKVGNVLLLGREKIPESACDFPDTYYTFKDLKSLFPFNVSNAPSDDTWRATHEGSLREVLSSWCSDLGYDFYWDYSSNNQVKFVSVNRGVLNIPDIQASNIISKEESRSMEGTFRQYGIGYTARPKSPLKTQGFSSSNVILYKISPYPISYFLNKINSNISIDEDNSRWGANRSKSEFLLAGYLGYVSRSLRDLYSFQEKHWAVLGYQEVEEEGSSNRPKDKIINFLKTNGFEQMMSDLESFDAEGLPNYNLTFLKRDPAVADSWHQIEQKLIMYQGRFYRSSDSSGSFFYCNEESTVEVSISVDPEASVQELDSEEFAGKKIIDRGGSRMSHSDGAIRQEIGYDDLAQDIFNCSPIHIDLKESGIRDALLIADLIEPGDPFTTIVIYPNSEKFVKTKLGFRASLKRQTNDLEKTIDDLKETNIKSGRKNCPDFAENLEKSNCKSLREYAREEAVKIAGNIKNDTDDVDQFISGLIDNRAECCELSLRSGGSCTFCGPADGQLQAVNTYNINVNKIIEDAQQFVWSVGDPKTADDVAEIRINSENVTNPLDDNFGTKREEKLIKPADAASTSKQKTIKYVFAGEPPSSISLTPENGLSKLDISLSSDGFTTSATFSTKPPKAAKANDTLRKVQSQLNRISYNAS